MPRQSCEERLEKKKVAERLRREKIKCQRPELYEMMKAQARTRYNKRKADGKVLPSSEMSSRQRKIVRERNCIYSRIYRKKKKEHGNLALQKDVALQEDTTLIEDITLQEDICLQKDICLQEDICHQEDIVFQEGIVFQDDISVQEDISLHDDIPLQEDTDLQDIALQEDMVICENVNIRSDPLTNFPPSPAWVLSGDDEDDSEKCVLSVYTTLSTHKHEEESYAPGKPSLQHQNDWKENKNLSIFNNKSNSPIPNLLRNVLPSQPKSRNNSCKVKNKRLNKIWKNCPQISAIDEDCNSTCSDQSSISSICSQSPPQQSSNHNRTSAKNNRKSHKINCNDINIQKKRIVDLKKLNNKYRSRLSRMRKRLIALEQSDQNMAYVQRWTSYG